MVVQVKRVTVEQFEAFARLPENADRLFEFIGGEIVEVPSNPYVSEIAIEIAVHIKLHLREQGIKGHVTGESGGCQVVGERYAPDVAYIASEKQAALPYEQGYNPNPPDLAVEVVSPSESDRRRSIKVANYLAAGTLVWVVYPPAREVEVYQPGEAVKIVSLDGTLDGGAVLPGFTLAVRDIFPPDEDDPSS